MLNPMGLSEWLVEAVKALSVSMWGLAGVLAGGSNGPLWRWALVELGLFALLLFGGSLCIAALLGRGSISGIRQRWGSAGVVAALLSFVWNWYFVTGMQAIFLGIHPQEGWERLFFSWGLPVLMAANLVPGGGFTLHFGIAMAFGAAILFQLGRFWVAADGAWRRAHQEEGLPPRQAPFTNGTRVGPRAAG